MTSMYSFTECKFSNVLLNESVTGKSSKDNVKTTVSHTLLPHTPAKTADIYIWIVNLMVHFTVTGASEAEVDLVWYSPSPHIILYKN